MLLLLTLFAIDDDTYFINNLWAYDAAYLLNNLWAYDATYFIHNLRRYLLH